MSRRAQFFRDPRRRNLVVLVVLALFSIAAALWSIHRLAPLDISEHKPAPLLKGFAQVEDRATKIHITSGGAAFDIVFSPDRGWIVPQRHSYPASFEQVRQLLDGLADLQTIAPKTSQKEWLAHLNLDKGGKGVGIRVSDEKDATLANIIVGKREALNGGNGQDGIYARKANESQSWLVRASFVPSGDPSAWLDKSVPAIAVGRIARVTLEPIDGPSFTVVRTDANVAFKLSDPPADRELADPAAPNDIGTLLPDFDFDDARPVNAVDFTNAPRAIVRTFDGLSVTVETTRQGSHFWSRIMARGSDPKTRSEARAIVARTGGWAYQLTPDRGQRFFTTLERMLLPEKKAAPQDGLKRLAPAPVKK